MKFEIPKTTELTLLQELCMKYGVTLDITEERVLNRTDVNEIEVILRYELQKARVKTRDRLNLLEQRIAKVEAQYLAVETNGNGELCMKLMADSEHLVYQRSVANEYMNYLNRIGV